ncbi:hypothetical protein GCM10007874_29100 [Labrys miyagiensis]|uniref:Uncharacterized protein n=1 Tax=Labrys miyagiensis TaxID=346912 RepID=A0ABQ6CHT0_9HYPH|nr:hypothetical protein [Labrys miyagiensis]GLS19893.1 hypothetical protein GCM10007874_29100 [Labrys miyagiensis]
MDLLPALNYGVTGLGGISAILSYYLLRQDRRNTMPVYVFMVFSLLIMLLGILSQKETTTIQSTNASLRDRVVALGTGNTKLQDQVAALTSDREKVNANLSGTVASLNKWTGYVSALPCPADADLKNPTNDKPEAMAYQKAIDNIKGAISITSAPITVPAAPKQ